MLTPHPPAACTNHTPAFRQLCRAADPQGNNAALWVREKEVRERGGRHPSKAQQEAIARRRQGEMEWINEARRIHRHTAALLTFLTSIKRPYLTPRPRGAAAAHRTAPPPSVDGGTFERWADVRWLDDEERNQVDFQAQIVIKRCLARVQELDKAEEVRKRTTPLAGTSALSRLLTLSATDGAAHQLASDQLAAHRAAITRFLSALLADASARLRDLQERRLRATRERQRMRQGGARTGADESTTTSASTSASAPMLPGSVGGALDAAAPASSAPELSAEQVQAFEAESSALLKSLSEDLAAVQAAERKLVDISDMQTQLLQHLGAQQETTDRLRDEAVANTSEVRGGNEQLTAAKRRNREANKFLSVFLVGSGLGLLFLHWMD